MSKFKVGPARLRDGRDAYIFEVGDTAIFGKFSCDSGEAGTAWSSTGEYFPNRIGPHLRDLMPNNEPGVVEFDVTVRSILVQGGVQATISTAPLNPLVGKRVKVRVEVLE